MEHGGAVHPVLSLIGELTMLTHCNYIQVRTGALSLTLQKARGP